MAAGIVQEWHVAPGETVTQGQILATVETDKSTIEWEAQDDVRILRLLVEEGDGLVAVGEPVACTTSPTGGLLVDSILQILAGGFARGCGHESSIRHHSCI